MTTTTFTAPDGATLHGTRTGDGEPLVLVHGSWTDSSTWGFVVDALAERFEVVTYDRRGHTRSAAAGTGPRSRDEDDLAAVIESLGAGPVHVVGNSYGASISLGLTGRRPDLVRTLAVHEPPLLDLLLGRPEHARLVAEVDEVIASVVAAIHGGRALAGAEEFVERIGLGPGGWALVPEELRQAFAANAATFLAMLDDPGWGVLDTAAASTTEVPVLLTSGDTSAPSLQAATHELAAAVDQIRHVVLPGVGHVPHLTHPDEYVGVLVGWAVGSGRPEVAAGRG